MQQHFVVIFFSLLLSQSFSCFALADSERDQFFEALKLSLETLPEGLKKACKESLDASVEYAIRFGPEVSKTIPWSDKVTLFKGPVTLEYLWQLEKIGKNVDTIALEIPRGGHAIDSILIAKRIRELGLNTFSGLTWCHSACTVLFQGGHERVIDPKGLLTYHGIFSNQSEEALDCIRETNLYLKSTLMALGFPEEHWRWFRSAAIINPEGANSLLEEGIATKIERKLVGEDERLIENAAKPDHCDKNPEDC